MSGLNFLEALQLINCRKNCQSVYWVDMDKRSGKAKSRCKGTAGQWMSRSPPLIPTRTSPLHPLTNKKGTFSVAAYPYCLQCLRQIIRQQRKFSWNTGLQWRTMRARIERQENRERHEGTRGVHSLLRYLKHSSLNIFRFGDESKRLKEVPI